MYKVIEFDEPNGSEKNVIATFKEYTDARGFFNDRVTAFLNGVNWNYSGYIMEESCRFFSYDYGDGEEYNLIIEEAA